jgi:hypothetical protein
MKQIVYIVGNEIDQNDTIPQQLLPHLINKFPSADFVSYDPTEELYLAKNKKLIFIDTVVNSKKVATYFGLDVWSQSPNITVHDFDLPLQLGFMQKLGKIKSIIIIGVPASGDKKDILRDVVTQLRSILS